MAWEVVDIVTTENAGQTTTTSDEVTDQGNVQIVTDSSDTLSLVTTQPELTPENASTVPEIEVTHNIETEKITLSVQHAIQPKFNPPMGWEVGNQSTTYSKLVTAKPKKTKSNVGKTKSNVGKTKAKGSKPRVLMAWEVALNDPLPMAWETVDVVTVPPLVQEITLLTNKVEITLVTDTEPVTLDVKPEKESKFDPPMAWDTVDDVKDPEIVINESALVVTTEIEKVNLL